MSVFRNSLVGDFTRGGQTSIHFIRMIWQVTKKFFNICIVLYITMAGLIFFKTTTELDRYYVLKYGEAYVFSEVFNNKTGSFTIKSRNSDEDTISYASVLNSKYVLNSLNTVYTKLLAALFLSLLVVAGVGLILVRFVYVTGRAQAGNDFVRGTEIVPIKKLKKILNKYSRKHSQGKKSNIKIAGLTLPYEFDKAHVLLIGSTGTGKSVNIRETLESIRGEGRRAIVYDVAGNFIKHFYRKDKDIILNPMDARSHAWDLFGDCKCEADFIAFSEAMIPDSYRRDFFDVAAKMVFSSMAYQLSLTAKPSMAKLMDLVLKVDFETVLNLVKNTDAASILNEEGGRMAASVRGVISANTRSLKFLKEEGNKFSIADWVKNDKDDSWVFVSCNDKQIDMLRPIITAWFNIFTSNVLSLPEDSNNRIYMIVDELPSLNKIPSLNNFLAQGRKYGGSALLGIQNHSQLVNIYGQHGANSICDLCSTWLILRCNSKEGAKWASENIGHCENIETSEGLSFGVNDIRDGVSVNKHRAERLVVSPTEIMNLPDLTGFLKLGRGFPVGKFTSKYKKYPVVAEHFLANSGIEQLGVVVDELITSVSNISDGLGLAQVKQPKQAQQIKKQNLDKKLELTAQDMEM
ncbi:MAG: type IV secretion system DNA-binding domain-containing protein [Rickettsiaceae bacterium]|nr:type IV secretion system DNA-binding domain-containing protein [Rickettsiaceae bacterium]